MGAVRVWSLARESLLYRNAGTRYLHGHACLSDPIQREEGVENQFILRVPLFRLLGGQHIVFGGRGAHPSQHTHLSAKLDQSKDLGPDSQAEATIR